MKIGIFFIFKILVTIASSSHAFDEGWEPSAV